MRSRRTGFDFMRKIGLMTYLPGAVHHLIVAILADFWRIVRSPRGSLRQLYAVSFLRNAVYLVVSSGVNLALGFVFWVVVARLHPASEVGLASALLSAVALLAFVGTMGIGFGIIRYLPTAVDKARLLNSSFTYTTLAAVAASLVFLSGLSWWSPELVPVRQNPVFFSAFVVFTATTALHSMAQNTFMAFRRTGFVLIQSAMFGVLKLALVVLLASFAGAFGIFVSQGVAFSASLGICLFVLVPQVLPRYRPLPMLRLQAAREIVPYSLRNYLSEGLWSLPVWTLPVMLLNVLGPEAAAYYYLAWAMGSLLLLVPVGISFSLFAEGSYAAKSVTKNIRHSFKLILLLLVPIAVIWAVFADKLLQVFGGDYSAEGAQLLRFFAASSIPASANLLYLGLARVEKNMKSLILVSAVTTVAMLGSTYVAISTLGILGVGVCWLVTQSAVAFFTTSKLLRKMRHASSQ